MANIKPKRLIYRVWHTETGMSYIGQTRNTLNRRLTNLYAQKDITPISTAIQEYGRDTFDAETLEENVPLEHLDIRESYWIEKMNTIYPNGYNMESGGRKTFKAHCVSNNKRSKAQMGERNSMYGKRASLETRQKMSDAHQTLNKEGNQ